MEHSPDLASQAGTALVQLIPERRLAMLGERQIKLTRTEVRLLQCFLDNPGRILTRQALMATAMREGTVVLDRTIDQHVCSLRRKLGQGWIQTIRCVGYIMPDCRGPV